MDVLRLRIESTRGSPVNDYRIVAGGVEFRVLDPSGHPYASQTSRWRRLDETAIQIHHALNTVVSQWLRTRRGDAPGEEDAGIRAA